MIAPIKAGSDSRKNWTTINQIAAAANGLGFQNQDRRGAIAGLRPKPTDALGQLFKLYQGSTWLKWLVQGDYIVTVGDPIVPSGVDTEFTLTSGVEFYWFYIDFTSTPTILTSDTALTWSATLLPIGWVDTNTYSGESLAIAHQNFIFNPCA